MKGKIYSPDEANRMLPLVSRIADDIVATYALVHEALRAFEAEKTRLRVPDADAPGANAPGADGQVSAGPDPVPDEAELKRRDHEVARLLDRFQGLIEEVEALGGTVKDYEHGCIDFYGEVDGEIVYLCWRRGEDSIAHWHGLDEGYANRHAIPVPHAA